ncbi:MAG TPA: hypothetical protein VGV64_06280 [Thermoplasmata archaeon]|nr:hypothetical protein [Thermoplasmata archaeon]
MEIRETPGGREPRLDDRVLELLSEGSGRIAFNGLRRALGVHPESLSRALRRLERDGSVRREEGGYALKEPIASSPTAGDSVRLLAEIQLPRDARSPAIVDRLAGRWLGPLRWLGVFDTPGDPRLVWSFEGGPGHVQLSVRDGTLRLLVDAPGEPVEGLERAAFELLGKALEGLRSAPRPRSATLATFLRPGPPAPLWAN